MRPVKDVVLIPGGRYLLVMYTHELSMWDISSSPTPRLCFQEDLSGSGEASFPRALDVWVEDNVVLVKVLLEIPRCVLNECSQAGVRLTYNYRWTFSSPISEKLTTARFFEITLPDSSSERQASPGKTPNPPETTFWIRDIGRVAWAGNCDPPDVNANPDRVLFKFLDRRRSSPRALLVWYPRNNSFATLVPDPLIEFWRPTEVRFHPSISRRLSLIGVPLHR